MLGQEILAVVALTDFTGVGRASVLCTSIRWVPWPGLLSPGMIEGAEVVTLKPEVPATAVGGTEELPAVVMVLLVVLRWLEGVLDLVCGGERCAGIRRRFWSRSWFFEYRLGLGRQLLHVRRVRVLQVLVHEGNKLEIAREP